ncbi:hypothetical protein BGX26_006069 [Mortierella sp. AD094]|nr:hypothetical protein BGX26_006069 [Mortierella sp. AD094]
MSHQRSKSFTSSGEGLPSPPAEPAPAPLSISVPRKRSMSISFGLPTSPLSYTGPSIVSSSLNNNTNTNTNINNNSSSNPAPSNSSFGTTPPTNLTGLSNSIPSLNRRFSSSFTNPLTNPFAGSANNVGTQPEERGRRPSLFGSSPPLSYHNAINNDRPLASEPPKMKETSGSGGIGGLFRKFSTSGRSGAAQHPMDSNDTGPPLAQQPGFGPLSNLTEMNKNQGPAHGPDQPNNNTINDLKQDKIQRSASPMRNMILNGQMLD